MNGDYKVSKFLSTPSARRATTARARMRSTSWNFYPRPPRGGRRAVHRSDHGQQPISIHALREEGDLFIFKSAVAFVISIHALREEGDNSALQAEYSEQEFLSTPSARRATYNGSMFTKSFEISIHALREEGDEKDVHRPRY